jgi:hypothetical protein
MHSMTRFLCSVVLTAACESSSDVGYLQPRTPSLRGATATVSEVTPVYPNDVPTGPLRLDDPSMSDYVGRTPRRLDVAQFRSALENVIGARWVGPRTVRTSLAPSGTRFEREADLIEYFAETLGRPNYVSTTSEVLDPTPTFLKLATDAVRDVCPAGLAADLRRPQGERKLLIEVTERQSLPADEAAIRRNIVALTLRFWGSVYTPDDPMVTGILNVFRAGSSPSTATPIDGWRAVCVDLATDPRFFTY